MPRHVWAMLRDVGTMGKGAGGSIANYAHCPAFRCFHRDVPRINHLALLLFPRASRMVMLANKHKRRIDNTIYRLCSAVQAN